MRYLISATLALSLATAGTALAANKGIGVDDMGADGDEHYYRVTCMDGERTNMAYLPDEGKICYPTAKRGRQCMKSSDIDAVAVRACANKKAASK